jgi:Uma2 family endonuclease
MTQSLTPRLYSVDEYLRRERDAQVKHEYRHGYIVTMAGGTVVHSRIVTNCIVALGGRLKGGDCAPFDSNLRVRISPGSLYAYPDVTVICGTPEIDPADRCGETVTNPKLVIEVLSPSTAKDDLGWKFDGYRGVESCSEYVVVDQEVARVQLFRRQPDGAWGSFDVAVGLNAVAHLRSLGLELPLSEIYAGVPLLPPVPAFPADESPH